MVHTKLTQVQAEVGSLHQAGVLTHGINIEVHEDWQAGECCHSEPHQEEQIGQEHQLQTQRQDIMNDSDYVFFNDVLFNHLKNTLTTLENRINRSLLTDLLIDRCSRLFTNRYDQIIFTLYTAFIM